MMAIVTNHGKKRVRERVGLKSKAVQTNADRAYKDGLDRLELSGSLRRYADYLYHQSGDDNIRVKIYNSMVYIFHNSILITTIPLPSRFMKIVEKIKEKKAGGHYGDG